MPMPRKIIFINEYIYHVCNRGIERRAIFNDRFDYDRFVQIMRYYRHESPKFSFSQFKDLEKGARHDFLLSHAQTPKLVDILSYCLMPNHFHLLLRQRLDSGVSKFLSNLSNSYAKYYNAKYSRIGPLYQGPFRAVFIETDEQLIHVSRYIHINPAVSSLIQQDRLMDYEWSSLSNYLEPSTQEIVETETILLKFSGLQTYADFITNQIDYAKQLEKIKHLILEE